MGSAFFILKIYSIYTSSTQPVSLKYGLTGSSYVLIIMAITQPPCIPTLDQGSSYRYSQSIKRITRSLSKTSHPFAGNSDRGDE